MEFLFEAERASDYELTLDGYRTEIADLEARARAVREAWFSADHEENRRQADVLDMEARGLRLSLAQIMCLGFADAEAP